MALKMRLSRGGAKKRPYYRIVIAEESAPRDGRFLEKVGAWDPMLSKESAHRVVLNLERVKYWLSAGAQPTDRVARFLDSAGLIARGKPNNPNKAMPGKKRLEREKLNAESAA